MLGYGAFPARGGSWSAAAGGGRGGGAFYVVVEALDDVPRRGFFQVGGFEAVDLVFERGLSMGRC